MVKCTLLTSQMTFTTVNRFAFSEGKSDARRILSKLFAFCFLSFYSVDATTIKPCLIRRLFTPLNAIIINIMIILLNILLITQQHSRTHSAFSSLSYSTLIPLSAFVVFLSTKLKVDRVELNTLTLHLIPLAFQSMFPSLRWQSGPRSILPSISVHSPLLLPV